MANAVERLSRLDTCALSDACDAVGMSGAALGITAMWDCPRIAGRVVTMKLKPADGQPSRQHLGTRAIDAASPGDVIVIDHRGRMDAAGWGGILSLAAKYKGLAGVIVDGACRDRDESREMEFPVFARSAVPVTARGRVVEESFNQPVVIGGLNVAPQDFVLADGSGIVFVPAARIDEVLDKAENIAHRERQMAERVKQGVPVGEVMGANYETMLKEWDT